MGYQDFQIQKIMKGDEISFHYLIDYYSKDLYYYAFSFVRVREVAEEVVSDVFLEVWNNKARLGEIQHLKSWLLILVRNKAISYLRKDQTENNTVSFEEIGEFQVPAIQSPDHDLISNEEMTRINQAIDALPPKCKEVFTFAKIERLPYKEIAEILNISVKTINIHIAKALNIIAEIIRE